MVAFTDEEKLVGESAKSQSSINTNNTIYDVKRMMGLKYNDEEVQKELKHFNYNVQSGPNGIPQISVTYKKEESILVHKKSVHLFWKK